MMVSERPRLVRTDRKEEAWTSELSASKLSIQDQQEPEWGTKDTLFESERAT
jgi:hypothetical protein